MKKHKTFSAKRLAALLVTLALALGLLAGCGSGATSSQSAGAASGSAPAGPASEETSPNAGKTEINIGLKADINGCHPYFNGTPATAVSGFFCESLTHRGADGSVEPYVAKSWEMVDDTTWLFDLEEGITFSNGEKLDAGSVVGTFEILQREEITWPLKGDITSVIESMEAVGDYQVKIKTFKPFSTLPLRLVLFRVLPVEYFNEVGDEGYTAAPIGSGPYKFVDYEKGSHATLEAVENHWKFEPQIKTLNFKVVLDSAARVAALESGDLDWIMGVPLNEMERLAQSGKFETASHPTTFCQFAQFNVFKCEALQDVRVRQALNMAINMEEIVDAVMMGNATMTNTMTFCKAFDGYDESVERYPYDPEGAKALLEEAGYGDGLTLTMNIVPASQLAIGEVSQVMQAQLAEVGVTLEIQEIENGLLRELYKTHETADIVITALGGWQGDATVVAELALAPTMRYSVWSGEEFEEMRIAIESCTDEAERAKLYTEMQQLEKDLAPAIPMWQTHETYAYTSSLKNWTPYANTNMVFLDAYFE